MSASGNTLQVLNPEQSEDEDDNVVVTDDSEKQLENKEVLAGKGQRGVGRHVVCNGDDYTPATHRTRALRARTTKTQRVRTRVKRRRVMRRIATGTSTPASGSS